MREVIASECDPAVAFALSQNTKPEHIFADALTLAGPKGATFSWCFLHSRLCKVPVPVSAGALHLFVSGFSCKANSTQNNERWTKDPCESHHFQSFVGCLEFCKKYRPQFVLLENVCGIQLQKARGQKETVLDEIMKQLQEVDGYEWKYFPCNSFVLPDTRPRVYFVGTRMGHPVMTQMTNDVEELLSLCESLPTHHINGFLLPNPKESPYSAAREAADVTEELSEQEKQEQQAAYMVARTNARKLATTRSAGKLPGDIRMLDEADRESKYIVQTGTAWQKAQLDIYQLITKQLTDEGGPLLTHAHPVADVPWAEFGDFWGFLGIRLMWCI